MNQIKKIKLAFVLDDGTEIPGEIVGKSAIIDINNPNQGNQELANALESLCNLGSLHIDPQSIEALNQLGFTLPTKSFLVGTKKCTHCEAPVSYFKDSESSKTEYPEKHEIPNRDGRPCPNSNVHKECSQIII